MEETIPWSFHLGYIAAVMRLLAIWLIARE